MRTSSLPLFRIICLGILSILIAPQLSFSQDKTEQIDKLLQMYADYNLFNGSALVSEQGEVIYKKGFGMANMEWDIPNAPDTKHRLGSISKQFTAMLILQLVDEGKLDLHEPISTYLPDYPKVTGDIITTHHLLTHTSGIPSYTSFPNFRKEISLNPYSPKEFTELFSDLELEFKPGEAFNYSNSGYFLLGVLIEEISGETYEDMLREHIFNPLEMNDSGYDNHADILKNRATGYEKRGNSMINSEYLDMTIPYAAGSLYSTVEDLYKWDQALYTDKILSHKLMAVYFKPQIPAYGDYHYAYGWAVGKDPIGTSEDSVHVISHGGGINGFNTIISRSLPDKSVVVLLNNTGGAPLNDITQSIRAIMHDKPYDLPKQSVATAVLDEILKNGINAGTKKYNSIKDSKDYFLSEREMNQIGYQLLGMDKTSEAVTVFKLIIAEFPNSSNAYDSYGEGLMMMGKNEEAIANYKKSVEMNPANQNGIDMLEKLGVDVSEYNMEVKVPEAILETYLGEYELMPEFTLTITKDGDQLMAKGTGQPALHLHAKSNTTFLVKEVSAKIEFNTDDSGKIKSLTLFQNGQEMVGEKM